MNKKVNFLRLVIFTIILISPIFGLLYGHTSSFIAGTIDIYMNIWSAPNFIFEKISGNESNVLKTIYWIVQLSWIFLLAYVCEKIVRFLFRILKK